MNRLTFASAVVSARRFGCVAVVAVFAGIAFPTASPVWAQDMAQEIKRLKRDLADLQRFVYSGEGGVPAPAPTTAADGVAGAQPIPGGVAGRLQVQIQDMDRRLRDLNGKLEEVQFHLRRFDQRLRTALKDMEFRLTRLEGGTPPVPSTDVSVAVPPGTAAAGGEIAVETVLPVPGQASAGDTPATGPIVAGQATTVISSSGAEGPAASGQPGTLGALIVDAQGNIVGGTITETATQGSSPQTPAATTEAPPPVTVQSQGVVEGTDVASASETAAELPAEAKPLYDHSLGLMRRGAYDEAETALKVFLDRHAEHDLASAALYWLGETYYVRDNYRDAAFAFVDVYSKHPKSTKAADSLLKLGMSLQALGNNNEACTAFGTLQAEFPNARRAVLKLAEDRAVEYGCP